MNTLPQRKKTPEEIAKLRESLGIPVDHAVAASVVSDDDPTPLPEAQSKAPMAEQAPIIQSPLPLHSPRPIHSLKRSERTPQLHAGPIQGPPAPVLAPIVPLQTSNHQEPVIPVPAPQELKPIPVDSKLPIHRHSEEEIAEIRRRDAIAAIAQGGFNVPALAPTPVVAIGYLLAIGGAAAPTLLNLFSRLTGSYTMGNSFSGGYDLLTVCSLAALPVAAFIFFKKTLSRHHAAFIAIIVFFALVFSALHYLPLLQNAT